MAVIRISGEPGSGKTTLGKRLAQVIGYEFYYTGKIFREMAAKAEKSIEEFYNEMANNPELEKSIDDRQAQLMNEKDELVVDGRIAPFLPSRFWTINILLQVHPTTGAHRQKNRPENKDKTVERILELSWKRLDNERSRYQKLYGIENHLDPKKFDIIIDTNLLNEEEAFIVILYEVRKVFKRKSPA